MEELHLDLDPVVLGKYACGEVSTWLEEERNPHAKEKKRRGKAKRGQGQDGQDPRRDETSRNPGSDAKTISG